MPRSQHCSTCQQETQHWWGTGSDNNWYCDQCTEYGRNLTVNDPQREQHEENNMPLSLYCSICKNPHDTYLTQGLCSSCHGAKEFFKNCQEYSSETIKPHWERLLTEWQNAENGIIYLDGQWENIQAWIRQTESTVLVGRLPEVKNRFAPRQLELLKEQLQSLEQQITHFQEQLTQEQTAQGQFQQEIQQLGRDIVNLRQEINQHLARVQSLETQLSTKTNELQQELTKTQQLSQNLTDLQQTKQTNEKSLKDKQKDLEKELQTSKTSTADLRKDIEDLKAQLEQSKEISKKDLAAEQKKLKETETKLTQQIEINQAKEQTIQDLENNWTNSQQILEQTRTQLTQSRTKITQLESQILNHEQLKEKYEQNTEELTRELEETKQENTKLTQELAQSQQESTEVSQALNETQASLQTKQEQLKKTRLEVASLQAQLKKMPKPEPSKLLTETEPVNPWLLGTILVVGVGLFLLLKRRKE